MNDEEHICYFVLQDTFLRNTNIISPCMGDGIDKNSNPLDSHKFHVDPK